MAAEQMSRCGKKEEALNAKLFPARHLFVLKEMTKGLEFGRWERGVRFGELLPVRFFVFMLCGVGNRYAGFNLGDTQHVRPSLPLHPISGVILTMLIICRVSITNWNNLTKVSAQNLSAPHSKHG